MIIHHETALKCRETLLEQYVSELQTSKKTIEIQKKTIILLKSQINDIKNQRFSEEKPEEKRVFFANFSMKNAKEEHLYVKSTMKFI